MSEGKPQPPAPPELVAPMRPLAIGTSAAGVAAGLVAWVVAFLLRPDAAWVASLAAGVVILASAVSLVFVALQGRQTVIAWSMKWLAGSAIRAGATFLLAAFAYALLRPDLLTYALSLFGGYIAVLIVETLIFTNALKRTYEADTESAHEKK